MSLARKAFLLAAEKHKHQMYGEHPYLVHLFDVYSILVDHEVTDQSILAAAWLHDVIEDTGTHYSEVKERTSKRVADIVYACTDELGKNRKERKERTLPKQHMNPDALLVKCADRLANASTASSRSMYREGFKDFIDLVKEVLFSEIDCPQLRPLATSLIEKLYPEVDPAVMLGVYRPPKGRCGICHG